ncbi:MAG: VOC family protein [Anaerolineales bacterium]|nr:VOC family protein [Anaerolineales bacterium]
MTKRNIVHIEIPAANVEEAARFYQDLFGWKIQAVPEMEYTMWEPAEGPGGGFSPLGEQVRPGDMMVYVDSEDIETDLARVEALGGHVMVPKTEIPNTGWFATFKDPTGNTVALYTSRDPKFNQ